MWVRVSLPFSESRSEALDDGAGEDCSESACIG